ncbi:MAG: hypothetical protein C0594_07300 [Marinilabiliales bacterium]|nr:MAG: hypothetical protein C0594_07300 [Marinilabiliales bacterium]
MRTLVLLLGIVFLSYLTNATENKVESKIEKVTVFPGTAQIFRTAEFSSDKGMSNIVISGISPKINQRSLQASGKGNFTIVDVKFRVKQPEPILPKSGELPSEILINISLLKDSIALLGFELEDYSKQKEVLNLEKQLLMNNKLVQGDSDTIPEIKEALTYLRAQLLDINTRLIKIMKKEYQLNNQKKNMDRRLAELQNYNSRITPPVKPQLPDYRVEVTILADQPIKGLLEISYMVNGAGWTPSYDLRADNVKDDISFLYKASVYQSTGTDWNDVKLTLSTASPNASYSKPSLSTYYLQYYQAISSTYGKRSGENSIVAGMDMPVMDDSEYAEKAQLSRPAAISSGYVNQNQVLANIEYKVSLMYNIPTDGQTHSVVILNEKIPTHFTYYLVPKLDKYAYLIAEIFDYEKFQLLAGQANIYHNGKYIGETSINPMVVNDTIKIALGKDRGIIADRKKTIDTERSELIGNNILKTFNYEITVKNTKAVPVDVVIEDQIPVSNTRDIIVKTKETDNAVYSEDYGMLRWEVSLSARASEKRNFAYSVEHNKNMSLAINN